MPPFLLCATPDVREAAARELHERGWSVLDGWRLPEEPWSLAAARVACTGAVPDAEAARAVVLAAARGAAVVALVDIAREHACALFDDLRRLGAVELRTSDSPLGDVLGLDPEQAALLRLLASGATVAEASRMLFLSRRSAHRRLAAARRVLGVRSNDAAVVAFARARTEPRANGVDGAARAAVRWGS